VRFRRAAIGIVCSLILAACSHKSATSYPGTAQLAHALNSNGVACTSLSVTAGGRATESAAAPVKKGAKPLVQQAASCTHSGGRLLLFTFKTMALRDRWLTLGQLYGSVVVGPNWTVSTRDKDVADQISGAIGGDVR
jgi:hypothetical protein